MSNSCLTCGGLIMEPGTAYGYVGKVCQCLVLPKYQRPANKYGYGNAPFQQPTPPPAPSLKRQMNYRYSSLANGFVETPAHKRNCHDVNCKGCVFINETPSEPAAELWRDESDPSGDIKQASADMLHDPTCYLYGKPCVECKAADEARAWPHVLTADLISGAIEVGADLFLIGAFGGFGGHLWPEAYLDKEQALKDAREWNARGKSFVSVYRLNCKLEKEIP